MLTVSTPPAIMALNWALDGALHGALNGALGVQQHGGH